MRQAAKATATALLVVAGMTAQAAEPETLTLACKGSRTDTTMSIDAWRTAKPEQISMGIIVNLTTEGAVEGFTYPAHINRFKATIIEFLGNTEGYRW